MTSILHFADIHFGVEDKEAMGAIKSYAESLKPDLVLICGDITQSGSVEEFEAAQAWIKTFAAPKVITPGNHDTPMFGLIQRIFNPFGRYKKYIAPLSEPFYADRNVMIVPYNTARGLQAKMDWSLGVVDLKDLKAVTTRLQSVTQETLKMIAVHHPLIYPPVSPLKKETENGREAVKALSDAGIDAVLSGHVHAPFLVERAPGETEILSIGTGTLSTRRRGVPASFNHIEIDEKTLRVSAIDFVNGAFLRQEAWVKARSDLKALSHVPL